MYSLFYRPNTKVLWEAGKTKSGFFHRGIRNKKLLKVENFQLIKIKNYIWYWESYTQTFPIRDGPDVKNSPDIGN